MVPVISTIEIKNIGGHKIKYKVDTGLIERYNKNNDNFTIFKLENVEGTLGPGDVRYIIGYFRPLTRKEYILSVPIDYTDEIPQHSDRREEIILRGQGYHPLIETIPKSPALNESMPKNRIFNFIDGKTIQRCGISLEVKFN
jgi:hypothetical protein